MTPMPPPATARPPTAPTRQARWWARAWDRLSIYQPVLLMGLLALGSYWVLRQAPQPEADRPDRGTPTGPDYVMREFALRSYFPDGRLKSEVFGQEARHYPARGELEIDQARLRSLDTQGRLTQAEARLVVTDDSQQQYLLKGQVVVVRQPPSEQGRRTTFQGEQLQLDTEAGTIVSSQPVTVLNGNDRLQADQLNYQDGERTASFQGRVKATLVPRP